MGAIIFSTLKIITMVFFGYLFLASLFDFYHVMPPQIHNIFTFNEIMMSNINAATKVTLGGFVGITLYKIFKKSKTAKKGQP